MLLEHMQGMKYELQTQIGELRKEMNQQFTGVDGRFAEMDRQFEEARLHREELQANLYVTMQLVNKHEKKLARR